MSEYLKALRALQLDIDRAAISDEEWASLTCHVNALLSFVQSVG